VTWVKFKKPEVIDHSRFSLTVLSHPGIGCPILIIIINSIKIGSLKLDGNSPLLPLRIVSFSKNTIEFFKT